MLLTLLVGIDDSLLKTLRGPEIWIACAVAAVADGCVSDRTYFVLLPLVMIQNVGISVFKMNAGFIAE